MSGILLVVQYFTQQERLKYPGIYLCRRYVIELMDKLIHDINKDLTYILN